MHRVVVRQRAKQENAIVPRETLAFIPAYIPIVRDHPLSTRVTDLAAEHLGCTAAHYL